MKVQLEKTFDLPGPATAAWAVLSDVERVAGCMPGARITERVDDKHYKGTVAVKFGPASMSFRGEVEVAQLDAAAQTVRLIGKGTDTTGGSGASMDITARIEAVDASNSKLVGASEVSMSGKAAAFGGRMASTVADQVLKQFAANFATQVQALAAAGGPPAAAAVASMAEGGFTVQDVSAASAAPLARVSSGAAAAAPVAVPVAVPTTRAEVAPLNGAALAWAVFKDWLRSLFGPRKA